MIIEISVAIAVLIFAILAFFIIRTLFVLQRTLKRIDHALFEMELKSKNLDPLLRTLSNLGDYCETKSERLANEEHRDQKFTSTSGWTSEWADWLLLSLKLGTKFLNRR